MLGTDVVVIEVACLFNGVLDDLFGSRSLGQFAHRDHFRARTGLDDLLDLQPNLAQVDIEVLQHIGRDAGTLFHEAQQYMFRADVLVVEALRLLVGELHNLAGSIGEALVHAGHLRRVECDLLFTS